MDGRHIFVNAGALFDAKTPNEIIGIFAHETGHLAGGHLQRLREQLATAQTAGIVALLAGIGAAVAASRAGAGGDVGAAAIMDALLAVKVPAIEVHITNIHTRESFRHNSYISKAAKAVIAGFGVDGYALAITGLAGLLGAKQKS